jgi:hypothetical protein
MFQSCSKNIRFLVCRLVCSQSLPFQPLDGSDRTDRRTTGVDSKVTDRFAKKIEREKARLASFKSDNQKEAFVELVSPLCA